MQPDTPPEAVTVEHADDVTVITVDDGKVNAFSHEVVAALRTGLAEAAERSRAVAIVGRPGKFSAGFDLTTMRSGPAEARGLLAAGAELAFDAFLSPVPVVVGCTGHALAMGAIFLLAVDVRIGAAGPFKIGMNEVAIGMPVPRFAIGLARNRLTPPAVETAVQQATVHDPEAARAAGFLDEVVDAEKVVEHAVGRARQLAAALDPGAFRATRSFVRGPVHRALVEALGADVATPVAGDAPTP